jgi:hypothetical protein
VNFLPSPDVLVAAFVADPHAETSNVGVVEDYAGRNKRDYVVSDSENPVELVLA